MTDESASEPALPQRMAQDHHAIAAGLILTLDERPAGKRGHAQQIEEIGGDLNPLTRSGRSPPPSVAPHACAALRRVNERALRR